MVGNQKIYLGDGAFVHFDGFAFVLTTSNGLYDTNIIVLEPEMISKLQSFVTAVYEAKRTSSSNIGPEPV